MAHDEASVRRRIAARVPLTCGGCVMAEFRSVALATLVSTLLLQLWFPVVHAQETQLKREGNSGNIARDVDRLRPPPARPFYDKAWAEADDWETEHLHEAAHRALTPIVASIEDPNPKRFGEVVTKACAVESFASGSLADAFRSAKITVRRPTTAVGSQAVTRPLAEWLQWLSGRFNGETVKPYFKIEAVDRQENLFTTRALISLSGTRDGARLQINSTWSLRWNLGDDNSTRLAHVSVLSYDEIEARHGKRTLFSDCTESVFAAEPSYRQQILPSINHWRQNLDALLGVTVAGHHGIAVGDMNGDGLLDLFSAQPAGLPNRLYLQNDDGTLSDCANEVGLDHEEGTRGALFLDFDNDGDQDAAVLTFDALMLFENRGDMRFYLRDVEPTPVASSLSAADYDLDGLLDIYVCCYMSPFEPWPAIPYHDANNGTANHLLRNKGKFEFVNVTNEVGLDQNNTRFSFAGTWEDYDNDGDPDLYVANDFGRNNLYRNDDGRFTDVAASAGVEDISAGMGVAWGDYDNDGSLDLYVSNMYSSAGGRIAYQSRFQQQATKSDRDALQRHARGNSLFRNRGDGTFEDVSVTANVTMGRWAWGSIFIDMNNDGHRDLYVPNGFITNESTQDL